MYPSKIERTWGAAPQAIAAIAHLFSAGLLTWVPGVIVHWLWSGRSRFVAFHSLQSAYLAGLTFVVGCVGGLLVFTHVFAWLGWIILGINWLVGLGLWIVGALAASRGEAFEYPVVGAIARRKVGL